MCPDESCANRWIVYLPWPTSVSLCMCLCLCVGIFALLHTCTGAHISTRAGRFRPLPHTLSTLLGQIHPFGATDRSTHTNTYTQRTGTIWCEGYKLQKSFIHLTRSTTKSHRFVDTARPSQWSVCLCGWTCEPSRKPQQTGWNQPAGCGEKFKIIFNSNIIYFFTHTYEPSRVAPEANSPSLSLSVPRNGNNRLQSTLRMSVCVCVCEVRDERKTCCDTIYPTFGKMEDCVSKRDGTYGTVRSKSGLVSFVALCDCWPWAVRARTRRYGAIPRFSIREN